MLGEFLYYVYHDNDEFPYIAYLSMLERGFSMLSEEMKQLYYDTVGVYYKRRNKYENALQYYNAGLQLKVSTSVLGMLYYHRTMILNKIGNQSEALHDIKRAKKYFDRELNQKRGIMCSNELAHTYNCLGHYEKAERIYLQCLEAVRMNPFLDSIILYNNLAWNSLLAKQYGQALQYAKEGMKQSSLYLGSMYFYCAYASWKLEHKADAIDYVKQACDYVDEESRYMKAMIYAFSKYLSKTVSVEKKEAYLCKAYQEAEKVHSVQLQVFVLKLIITLEFSKQNSEKQIAYRDQLIELLQQQC